MPYIFVIRFQITISHPSKRAHLQFRNRPHDSGSDMPLNSPRAVNISIISLNKLEYGSGKSEVTSHSRATNNERRKIH